MPAVLQLEEIRAPLLVIEKLNAAKGVAVSDHADVEAHFRTALDGRWADVPLLNSVAQVEEIPAGSLVRFRCMVQNMYNPEWYVGDYTASNPETGERRQGTAQYRESLDLPAGFTANMDAAASSALERVPLHCMSIPHESSWVNGAALPAQQRLQVERAGKRRAEEDDMMDDAPASSSSMADSAPAAGMQCETDESKRSRGHGSDAPSASGAPGDVTTGRPPLVHGATPKHAAIVKVYGNAAAGTDACKVNETIEVVGILTLDPAAATFGIEQLSQPASMDPKDAGAGDSLLDAPPPPSSVLPRIHAITLRRLSPAWNPGLDNGPSAARDARSAHAAAATPAARARILARLAATPFLGGDALAAEFVLLNALSRVLHRSDGAPIGAFAVAISTDAKAAVPATSLVSELKRLLPAVAHLPLSPKALGAKPFVPKKDYDTETLHSAALQLAPSTQVVIDETTMEAGLINEQGVQNLTHLQNVINTQSVPFDFGFYQVDFPADLPVLIASHGKPMLQVGCVLKVEPDASRLAILETEAGPSEGPACDEADEVARVFLVMARNTDVSLAESVCRLAEERFIAARQANPKEVDQHSLARWLTMARLLAASHGQTQVTDKIWERAMELEEARVARNVVSVHLPGIAE